MEIIHLLIVLAAFINDFNDDCQHNDIQPNDTQSNDTQSNDTV
jgi:hypothetical protein